MSPNRAASARFSALNIPEDEQPRQESIRLRAAADGLPVSEGAPGQLDLVEGFAASEAPGTVVVGLVPGLLKIDEGFGKRP